MKYLLKVKRKHEEQNSGVAINLTSKYEEFDSLNDIVDYVFKNSQFIESYIIYKLHELS